MKLLTALFLSSKKRAYTSASRNHSVLFGDKLDYVIQVLQNDNSFTLQVIKVLYVDRQPGKGWGKPVLATSPHYAQDFAQEELFSFLQGHDMDPEKDWWPVEDDNRLFYPDGSGGGAND